MMNLPIKSILTAVSLLSLSGNTLAETTVKAEALNLSGPYLGQTPPSLTPQVFAPDIVSTTGWEYGVVFSPSLKEMYFLREVLEDKEAKQEFVVFEQQGEQWQERVISPRVGTPTLSPDNQKLFFGRAYKSRTESGWSEMKRLGEQFDEFAIMRVTASLNGTLVFDEATSDSNSVLRYATLANGAYSTPKPLPKHINTGKWNAHPFIAPDESYIIWDGQRDTKTEKSNLFISFKEPNGTWGEAIKFGEEVNTPLSEFAAQVSPDGKYLFFNRSVDGREVDTYWVDAKVIDQLKPDHIVQFERKKNAATLTNKPIKKSSNKET